MKTYQVWRLAQGYSDKMPEYLEEVRKLSGASGVTVILSQALSGETISTHSNPAPDCDNSPHDQTVPNPEISR